MQASAPIVVNATPNTPAWLELVRQKVTGLRYGVVQIIIHDAKVTQIERTERTRLSSSEVVE
jgi:hypothetical protein